MNNQKGFILPIIIAVIVVAILGAAGYVAYKQFSKPEKSGQVVCAQDAKQCPDASYVSRTGPNCEFAECPAVPKPADQTAGWKTFDSGDGFEFKYPVIKSFIVLNDPEIIRGNSNINSDGCFLGNNRYPNPVAEKGKNLINNTQFCVSTTGDSAMGHSYPTYFYTTTYKDGNHFTLVFSFDVTACGNLKGGSNYKLCQDFFSNSLNNPDKIVQSIISTFRSFSN